MSPDFKPYRVDVEFARCDEASIKPLIERLSFIRSKTHWGGAFTVRLREGTRGGLRTHC